MARLFFIAFAALLILSALGSAGFSFMAHNGPSPCALAAFYGSEECPVIANPDLVAAVFDGVRSVSMLLLALAGLAILFLSGFYAPRAPLPAYPPPRLAEVVTRLIPLRLRLLRWLALRNRNAFSSAL